MSVQSHPKLDLSKYIEVRIFGERPHIRGRRIPVATIAHCARSQGWSNAELAYNFGLSEQEVLAALLYYRENAAMIEAQEEAYQEELDEAYDDLANRRRYLNARNTLMTLLEHGILPIINENDTVVVDEIRFGDNDNLSAMATNLVEAQLLVILSDVDGLYDSDPRQNPQARLITEVERVSEEIEAMAGEEGSALGTGGMATKIKAAKRATLFGAGTAIINGRTPHNLGYLFDGHELGTYFLPARDPIASRKHWIAFTKKPRGKLLLDDGARTRLDAPYPSLFC